MPEFETATALVVRNFVSSFRASDPRERAPLRADNFAAETPEIRVLPSASGHVRAVSGTAFVRMMIAEILLSSD